MGDVKATGGGGNSPAALGATAKPPPKFQAGLTAILSGVNMRGIEVVTVARTGRNTAYIEWGNRQKAFDLFTGEEKGIYGHYHLWTHVEWDAQCRRDDNVKRLREHGLEFTHRRAIDDDTLAAVVNLLDERAAP